MSPSTEATRQIADLQRSVQELRRRVRRILAEREQAARTRRRRLLVIGVGVSILAHIVLLLYFAALHRGGGGDGWGRPASYEVALLPTQQLSDLDELDLDDLSEATEAVEDPALEDPAVLTEAAMPAAELQAAEAGSVPAVGGSGGAEGDTGLGGSGGGTSYFGIAARGNRFAFIVDRSGSMMHRNRMEIAMNELVGAIESLPDYAYFKIILFSSDMMEPPTQRGWIQARRQNVSQVTRWLRGVSPSGGTLPRPSFYSVFELDVLPDVIYFMTDGIIAPQNLTAEEVARLNRGGRRVTIHTIAFGDQGSEELLRRIARESGGSYRFVPDRE